MAMTWITLLISVSFRYFYLIVFAMYVREVGPKEYNQTFKQWMDEHADLRDMIAEGRSKLEWERKIPDEKLMDLKSMLDSPDFKTNLPKVKLKDSLDIFNRYFFSSAIFQFRLSRGSMSWLGNNSLTFLVVSKRTDPCTS